MGTKTGPECALKKVLREGCTGAFCSCLTHLLASNQMSSLQVPQEYGRVTVARFLWRQCTGAVAWDTSSSSVLARETRVQQHQILLEGPHLVLVLLLQGGCPRTELQRGLEMIWFRGW